MQDRLIRLEKSSSKVFRDDVTQSVWFRNMQNQNVKTEISDSLAIIDTGKVKLVLKPNRKDCRIEINGLIY